MKTLIEATWGPASSTKQEVHLRIQAEPTRKVYWEPESTDKHVRFLNKIDLVVDYKLKSWECHTVERVYQLLKGVF